jgi:hypothetical protein
MASSFSTDLKLELMVTGENSGTWGDKTNTNLNLLQQAIAGYQAITLTSINTTLAMTDATISDARNAVIKFTGTLGANSTVFVASGIEKTYTIENGTTGAYTLALNQVGGASVIWATTDKTVKQIYLNGTDAIDIGTVNLTAPQTLTNKTLTSPTINTATLNTATINTATITSPIINEIDDNAGNEFIIFSKVTTAVNEITISNAATGGAPNIAATGSDTNVDLYLTSKGAIGNIVINGNARMQGIEEKTTTTAIATTGTINFDTLTQAVLYYTSAATGNFTVNFRGNSTVALNSCLAIGDSYTAAFMNTNTTTAYYTTFVTIDGTSTNVSTKWQGGSTPSAGNADSIDTYAYSIIKTAASTYTVLASQTQFK